MKTRSTLPLPARSIRVGLVCLGAILVGWEAEREPTNVENDSQTNPVSFGEDVRPILVRSCLACHGFDPSTREAELRLDTFEEATRPRGQRGSRAISPGDPVSSMMLDRVSSDDPEFRMPPIGEPLSEDEVALLERWIEGGARYERHWSLEPINVVEPTQAADPVWDRGPIDRFMFAEFNAAGLAPGGVADRRVLIRRLSFDLTGLPPAPERVEEFVGDTRPDAVEQLVDELLASPRFGERWARHWLDLMRYAETYAHEFDFAIVNAWGYRDYVIRALNQDVAYNDFVTEHLAGDLMPEPRRDPSTGTNESILGTGFWWLSQGTHAPVDVRGDEAERIDNQIDVFTKSVLATTVSCARCHDHKFDPILQSEYYGFSGFIQSSRRQQAYLDPGGEIEAGTRRLRDLSASADELLGRPRDFDVPDDLAALLLGVAQVLGPMPEQVEPKEGESPEPRVRERVRPIPEVADEIGVSAEDLQRWVRIFETVDPVTPNHPLTPWLEAESGINQQGDEPQNSKPQAGTIFESFDTTESATRWRRTGWAFDDALVSPQTWRAPGERDELTVAKALDSGKHSVVLQGTARSETFEITQPYLWVRTRGHGGVVRVIIDGFTMDEYNALLFESCNISIDHTKWRWRKHDLSKYVGHRAHYEIIDDSAKGWVAVDWLVFSDSDQPPTHTPLPSFESEEQASLAIAAAVESTIGGEGDAFGLRVTNWLFEHRLLTSQLTQETYGRDTFRQLTNGFPVPQRGLAMEDGTSEDERLFVRGSHKELGEVAPRGFLSALSSTPEMDIPQGSGRLQLASAVFDETNPMPARVMVNRVWHHLLGRGIVPTTDDFGLLGESPSHPELLDYLADRFAGELGWSVKSLIREIVLSRSYRGASEPMSEAVRAVDPDNRLLSVRTPKRLDGESIRDAMLAVSGRLDLKMHGKSVPTYLTEFMNGRGKPGSSGPVDGNGRRSVYLEVRRNFMNPMMMAFDSPVPHSTMGKRSKSNVPAQSLILMNSPLAVQQSGVLADRLIDEASDDRSRIDRLYRLALGREPTSNEIEAAAGFLVSQSEAHEQQGHENPELAALTDLCHVVYNLKEFSFLE